METLNQNLTQDKNFQSKESKEKFSLRFLVADDQLINRASIKDLLVDEGHQVVCVNNGQELIDELNRDQNFDLILTDKNMPELSGIDAIKQIRRDGRFSKLPIILMTSEVLGRTSRKELEDLQVFYLPKPFLGKDLFKITDQLIGEPEMVHQN